MEGRLAMKRKSGLIDFVISTVKTKEVIKSIKKQNGALLGRRAAEYLDMMLDTEFGNKKSYQIEKHIVPFTIDFCDGFTEELLKR